MMPIDFQAVGQTLQGEMAFRGDTPAELSEQWGVSRKTVQNAMKGRKLVADLFIQVCLYTGANPLSFWKEGMAVDYSALSGMEEQEYE